MKAFLFTTIVCAALTRGVCNADSSAPGSRQSERSSLTTSNPSHDNAHVVSADEGKPMAKKPGEQDYRASGDTADPSHSARRFDSTDNGRPIEGRPQDKKNNDHLVSSKDGPGNQIDVEKEKNQPTSNWKEQQMPGNHNFNTLANTINPRQSANPAGLANGRPLKTANYGPMSARPTGVVGLGSSSFGNTHNHSSVPAIIGGPASVKRSMTATIKGTAMFHKP
jgi:hypothetical protein